MKSTLCVIIYNGEDEKSVVRKDYQLPDVSAEEFEPKKHMGKVFQHPEGDITNQSIYIWKYCTPENEEEEKLLIDMGKWGALPTSQ